MDTLKKSLEVLGEAVETLSEKKGKSKDQKLKAKFMNPTTGRFKGKKGQRFDNCVKYFQAKGGIGDPEGLCGKIARGKAEDADRVSQVSNALAETVESLFEYRLHGSDKKRVNVLGHDGKKVGRKKMTHGKCGKGCR